MIETRETPEKYLNEELSGSIDFEVVDVSEGQLVRLKDGTLLDPEIFISYFSDLSAFEEEFGPLHEAKDKLRELKKLEEEFGPVSEISESLNRLYEQAERLLESDGGYYEEYYGDSEEDEEEDEFDDEDGEEYDVSDLTVKQLLALLLAALLDEEDGADEDVDLEDLDLERIGNMSVGELMKLIREGKVKEVSESSHDGGCGCGNKNRHQESYDLEEIVDKLFEENEGEAVDLSSQPSLGVVETPNATKEEEEREDAGEKEEGEKEEGEKEEKEEVGGEEEDQELQDQTVQVKSEDFGLDIFKRLLDRLG